MRFFSNIRREAGFLFKQKYLLGILRPVDLCCTYFTQQYIGNHIIENASETILA
ncbi:hypothetical protein GCM10027170_43940 [Aliiglaciecola aliphaticivorans]